MKLIKYIFNVALLLSLSIASAQNNKPIGQEIEYPIADGLKAFQSVPMRLIFDDYDSQMLELNQRNQDLSALFEPKLSYAQSRGLLSAVGKFQVIVNPTAVLRKKLMRWRIHYQEKNIEGVHKLIYNGSGLLIKHADRVMFITHLACVFDKSANITLYFNYHHNIGKKSDEEKYHLDEPSGLETYSLSLTKESFYSDAKTGIAGIVIDNPEIQKLGWIGYYQTNIQEAMPAFAAHYPANEALRALPVQLDAPPLNNDLMEVIASHLLLSPGAPIFNHEGDWLGVVIYQYDEPQEQVSIASILRMKKIIALIAKM